MNILYAYRDFLQKGGLPSYTRALAEGVAADGHQVTIVAVAQPERPQPQPPPSNCTVHEVPGGRASEAAFDQVLRTFRPDLVHFPGGFRFWNQISWGRAVRRAGIPYVVTAGGHLSPLSYRYRWGGKPNHWYHFLAKKGFYYLFDSTLLRHAAAVHSYSDYEAGLARRAGARATIVLPFAPETETLPDPHHVTNRSLHTPPTFTYLGRLSPFHKGLDLVLDAFGDVVKAGFGDHFRLVLAGTDEGGSMDQLKRRAAALGITRVEFPGGLWGEAKSRLWAESDFFIHVARFNGFALAAREALSYGLPLLTSRESDYGDWVSHYDMGAVAPLDVKGLAGCLLELLQLDEATYRTWSKNAAAYVHNTNKWAVGQQFAEAYEQLLTTGYNAYAVG